MMAPTIGTTMTMMVVDVSVGELVSDLDDDEEALDTGGQIPLLLQQAVLLQFPQETHDCPTKQYPLSHDEQLLSEEQIVQEGSQARHFPPQVQYPSQQVLHPTTFWHYWQLTSQTVHVPLLLRQNPFTHVSQAEELLHDPQRAPHRTHRLLAFIQQRLKQSVQKDEEVQVLHPVGQTAQVPLEGKQLLTQDVQPALPSQVIHPLPQATHELFLRKYPELQAEQVVSKQVLQFQEQAHATIAIQVKRMILIISLLLYSHTNSRIDQSKKKKNVRCNQNQMDGWSLHGRGRSGCQPLFFFNTY